MQFNYYHFYITNYKLYVILLNNNIILIVRNLSFCYTSLKLIFFLCIHNFYCLLFLSNYINVNLPLLCLKLYFFNNWVKSNYLRLIYYSAKINIFYVIGNTKIKYTQTHTKCVICFILTSINNYKMYLLSVIYIMSNTFE